MFEQILAALLVLALLAGMLWLLRRKGLASVNVAFSRRLGGSRQMQIVERMPLTAQHSLHLVRVGGRLLVVGVSPSGCNRIAAFRAESYAEVASEIR